MKSIEELIAAHLNDEATTDEVERLFQWVRQSPENAREFARFALLHAQLRGQLAGEKRACDSGEYVQLRAEQLDSEPVSSGRRSWPWALPKKNRLVVSSFVAATIVLAFILGLSSLIPKLDQGNRIAEQRERPVALATVSQTADAQWGGEQQYQNGDRIGVGVIDLRSGFVRLRFDNGVEVTLQGPVRFGLLTLDHSRLASGMLTANVPSGAEGFRVNTPTADIVDLGTTFGVNVDESGVSYVSVFDGEVEVARADDGSKQLLKEGEAVRVAADSDIESVEFEAAPFEKVWPVFSGIAGSTGAFRVAPPWPRRLSRIQSDTTIFVVPEGYSMTLSSSLNVDITDPGEYRREAELVNAELPSGTQVRSYLLQFNPFRGPRRRRPARIAGEITFDRPVLGLIVREDGLVASDSRFSQRMQRDFQPGRKLELFGNQIGDLVTLSPDRRTVALDLAAVGHLSDHIRVIVDDSH